MGGGGRSTCRPHAPVLLPTTQQGLLWPKGGDDCGESLGKTRRSTASQDLLFRFWFLMEINCINETESPEQGAHQTFSRLPSGGAAGRRPRKWETQAFPRRRDSPGRLIPPRKAPNPRAVTRATRTPSALAPPVRARGRERGSPVSAPSPSPCSPPCSPGVRSPISPPPTGQPGGAAPPSPPSSHVLQPGRERCLFR